MPQKISAGLLMYRFKPTLEVFLIHPGGPFYKNKDEGVWSIPKGELNENESVIDAAQREFEEETGIKPYGPFTSLGDTRLKSGKTIHAFSFKGDWDGMLTKVSTFALEWPPKSGKIVHFPEVDRAAFFSIDRARKKLHEAQHIFLKKLEEQISNIKS